MEKEELEIISQRELMERIKLSRWAVYRAIKSGKLHPIVKGNKNYFKINEVEKWLESGIKRG